MKWGNRLIDVGQPTKTPTVIRQKQLCLAECEERRRSRKFSGATHAGSPAKTMYGTASQSLMTAKPSTATMVTALLGPFTTHGSTVASIKIRSANAVGMSPNRRTATASGHGNGISRRPLAKARATYRAARSAVHKKGGRNGRLALIGVQQNPDIRPKPVRRTRQPNCAEPHRIWRPNRRGGPGARLRPPANS
jgi:hypothetical protein